jgi:plastocyanin
MLSLLASRSVPKRRTLLAASLVVASLLVAACGGADAASDRDQRSSTTSAAPAGTSIAIDTFTFTPTSLGVHVGDTVTWTNKDSILHTVTSGMRDYDPSDSGRVTATNKDGMFDLQLDGKGATAEFTFTKAGTFHYFCDRHPGMEADIAVS